MTEASAFEFHSGARATIEERGRTLLSRIREDAPAAQPPQTFQSERPIAATYTDTHMIGTPRMWRSDNVGRKTAALFWRDDRAYGLFDADYQELRSVVDLASKSKSIRRRVSAGFLEDIIFDWCESQFNSATPSSLCDSIVAAVRTAVQWHTVWVPIANLETEVSFAFGPVRIDRITKEMIDKQETHLAKDHPDAVADIAAGFEKLRHKLQGLAAVVIEIEAEPQHAFDRAIEIADVAIGLLRFFSLASLTPWCLCPSTVLGSELIPSGTALILDQSNHLSHRSKVLISPAVEWRITKQLHDYMLTASLPELGTLVEDDGLTEFQRSIRSSILTYSKGMTLPDLNDRIVYTLSALEGLLLKNSSEPLQQNLAERVAFLLFKQAEARWDTVRNLRRVYDMRSKYIHHRVSLSDERQLETFVRNANLTLSLALKYSSRFTARADFISAIDHIKFGGPSRKAADEAKS